MRIGIFTDAYYPIISGVSMSIDILTTELRKLNHEVVIITFEGKNAVPDDFIVRFKGKALPMNGLKDYKIAKVRKKNIKDLENLNLDIVHVHTEFTMGRIGRKYARKYNVPLVYTYHTMYEEYVHFVSPLFKGVSKRIIRKYCNSFIKSVDQAIFPTIKVKNKFDSFGYNGTPKIIPTGIYLERFRKINFLKKDVSELRDSLGIKPDETVLVFLGRISREKSLDVLITKFSELSKVNNKVKLLVVGGGPDMENFKILIQNLNIEDKVIFTGMVSPKVVALYYQAGDIFVNFSTTETQGLTYIEALASGVPLLVKYDDNLEDVIINGQNGYSFTDDNEFIPLFNKMTSNRLVFDELTNNTTKTIKKFSAENFAKNILETYKSLLK